MNSVFSGIDLVEISRFKDLNPAIRKRFFERVFTSQELAYIQDIDQRAAGIFAAKEAAAKTLGCGIGPISWQEIEILHSIEKKPLINLNGKAQELSHNLGINDFSVSITHTKTTAAAVVIAIS